MGGRSLDSLQCFTYLKDNIPSWITNLSDLVAHTTAKRAEFTAEYSKLTTIDMKSRRRKNSSVHSIRPDDMHPTMEGNAEASSNNMNPDDSHVDPVALLKLSKSFPQEMAQRKRKTEGGSISANDKDRVVRPRHPLIIHYDSETQSILEQLVRDIGGARNSIRKGRMNQMMKSGFGIKIPSANSLGDDRSRNILKASMTDPKSSPRSRKDASGARTAPPFDLADKQLELAQSLCESAAHQFLRNGDCSMELENAKERFSSVLEIARAEVERQEADARLQQVEKLTEEKPEPNPVKHKELDKNPPGVLSVIEVDDASSKSSISFDMAAFRATRFRV
jgi:hypothetical protein